MPKTHLSLLQLIWQVIHKKKFSLEEQPAVSDMKSQHQEIVSNYSNSSDVEIQQRAAEMKVVLLEILSND